MNPDQKVDLKVEITEANFPNFFAALSVAGLAMISDIREYMKRNKLPAIVGPTVIYGLAVEGMRYFRAAATAAQSYIPDNVNVNHVTLDCNCATCRAKREQDAPGDTVEIEAPAPGTFIPPFLKNDFRA